MKPDFSPWNELLHRYVDTQGRVDYAAWKTQKPSELSEWLAQIATLNLSNLVDDHQRLALWINIYNALTIAKVLALYPIDSIFPRFFGIPNWIALFWFFQRPNYQWGKHRYSLGEIEHKILRKQFSEPRIHFAIVCASVGCPLLRPEAYFPERVEAQLSEDAQRFINNPAKVYYDTTQNILYLNPIFRWYRQDFLTKSPSLLEYIQLYASTAISPDVSLKYTPYDWSLNDRASVPTLSF